MAQALNLSVQREVARAAIGRQLLDEVKRRFDLERAQPLEASINAHAGALQERIESAALEIVNLYNQANPVRA